MNQDDLLLSRVAAGSEDALKQLYDRYSGLIHSVAFKILGDVSEACLLYTSDAADE